MKILHILDHSLPIISGYSIRSNEIMLGQKEMGYDICGVTSLKQGKTEKDIELINNISMHRTFFIKKFIFKNQYFKNLNEILQFKKKIENTIESFNPDIIHIHSPILNALATLYIAKKRKIPIVYEIRAFWEDAAVSHHKTKKYSFRYQITKKIETRISHLSNSVVTICNGLKEDIVGRGVSNHKIHIVPNGINMSTKKNTNKNVLLENLNLRNNIILGYVGSLYQYEGIVNLVENFQFLLKNISNLKLIIIGDGPEKESIKKAIQKHKLYDKVILMGTVNHDEISLFYSLFDICVFPRIKMRLTELVTPLKPIEAMSFEVPVIASEVNGHKEIIKNNETGLLYNYESKNDLLNKIKILINNDDLRNNLILNAKNYILKERNWKKNINKYKQIYESIICEN